MTMYMATFRFEQYTLIDVPDGEDPTEYVMKQYNAHKLDAPEDWCYTGDDGELVEVVKDEWNQDLYQYD